MIREASLQADDGRSGETADDAVKLMGGAGRHGDALRGSCWFLPVGRRGVPVSEELRSRIRRRATCGLDGVLLRVADLNIEKNLRMYLGDRKPTSRYASFDYCFNYFQSHREEGRLDELAEGECLQLWCLHLGFYLASWGMLRGSSELLQRSVRAYVPVVEALISAPAELWELDTDSYSDAASNSILTFARDLRATLQTASRVKRGDAPQALVPSSSDKRYGMHMTVAERLAHEATRRR